MKDAPGGVHQTEAWVGAARVGAVSDASLMGAGGLGLQEDPRTGSVSESLQAHGSPHTLKKNIFRVGRAPGRVGNARSDVYCGSAYPLSRRRSVLANMGFQRRDRPKRDDFLEPRCRLEGDAPRQSKETEWSNAREKFDSRQTHVGLG